MRIARLAACLALSAALAGCGKKPVSVDITPKKVTIYGIAESKRLSARVLDKKGEAMSLPVNWVSSKPEVATVDGGRVVAVAEGKTMITANHQGIQASVPVEVLDVKTFEIHPPLALVVGPIGTRIPLKLVALSSKEAPVALKVEWTSSDPKIAEIGQDGIVTSRAPGTATIMAKMGELAAASEMTVLVADIARIDLRPATGLVRVGESQRFTLLAYSSDGSPVEGAVGLFRSDTPAVAQIDPLGVATGIAPGTATIRVELADRIATATLIVN